MQGSISIIGTVVTLFGLLYTFNLAGSAKHIAQIVQMVVGG